MKDEQKRKVGDFLKKHTLAVISTVDAGGKKPESALVGFAENENLELVFGTPNKSRKYTNLLKNQNVSFVIGWDDSGTLQYEGTARELSNGEAEKYLELLFAKNPRAAKFEKNKNQRYFLVSPAWIRLMDFSKVPPESFEITF